MDQQERRSGRTALIYVLPAPMDLALALILFVGTVRVAKLAGGATRVASVLAVWSVVYVVACPFVGRLVNPRNAPRFVLGGCLLFALVCGLLAVAPGFAAMLTLMGVGGMAAALFFPSFQVFMKDMDAADGRHVSYSTGLYTFAWSSGFACGPFVAGFLMQFGKASAGGGEGSGWRYAFLFGAAICLLLSVVLALTLRARTRSPRAPEAIRPAAGLPADEALPDLAWLGWGVAVAMFTALASVRTALPARGVRELHLSEGMLGTIFFVLSMTQALTGLALARSRTWMYRARPMAACGAAGCLGLLCFGLGSGPAAFLIGAVLFGMYTGAFCFYMVFHALVHPNRAGRYVAVNETIVGVTGFVAPLAAGALADAWGFKLPYLLAAGLTLVVTAFQMQVHRMSPRRNCP